MESILKLVLAVLAEIAGASRLRVTAVKLFLAALLVVAGAAAFVGAIACGVAALWITLIPLLGAAGVALAMAGLLLLIALIASVASWQLAKRRRKASRFAEIIGVLQKEGVADHIALLLAALFAGALAGSKKSAST